MVQYESRMYSGQPVAPIAVPPGPVVLAITGVTVVDSTTIRINFNVAAKDNTALVAVDNYVVTPPLDIFSIIPEPGGAPTYVVAKTTEQKNGESYVVEIHRVEVL